MSKIKTISHLLMFENFQIIKKNDPNIAPLTECCTISVYVAQIENIVVQF